MNKKENPYVPSAEEIKKAEEQMTEPQKELSIEREMAWDRIERYNKLKGEEYRKKLGLYPEAEENKGGYLENYHDEANKKTKLVGRFGNYDINLERDNSASSIQDWNVEGTINGIEITEDFKKAAQALFGSLLDHSLDGKEVQAAGNISEDKIRQEENKTLQEAFDRLIGWH